jgi:hypothetical protein
MNHFKSQFIIRSLNTVTIENVGDTFRNLSPRAQDTISLAFIKIFYIIFSIIFSCNLSLILSEKSLKLIKLNCFYFFFALLYFFLLLFFYVALIALLEYYFKNFKDFKNKKLQSNTNMQNLSSTNSKGALLNTPNSNSNSNEILDNKIKNARKLIRQRYFS